MKRCPVCEVEKDRSEFHRNKSQKDGLSTYCKSCRRIERNKKRELETNRSWRIANPKKAMLHGARRRAKKQGLPFDLHPDDFDIPEVCPVLGIKLTSQIGGKRHDGSATLDRIENRDGYVKGNVVVISWRANRLKSDGSLDELKRLVAFYEGLRMRQTHTYVELPLSAEAYTEIAEKLKAAGYDHAFMEDGVIDMHGIGVSESSEETGAGVYYVIRYLPKKTNGLGEIVQVFSTGDEEVNLEDYRERNPSIFEQAGLYSLMRATSDTLTVGTNGDS